VFCSHCGKELNQDANFCIHCGRATAYTQPLPASTPSSVEPKASKGHKRKNLLFGACGAAVGAILIVVILLLSGALSPGGAATVEGPGFATPEAAAKAYLSGLRDQDMDAMLSSFAVESYASHYNFAALVERLKSYHPTFEMRLPGTTGYTQRLNIEGRRNQLANQIIQQYMAYNAPDELRAYAPVTFRDSEEISEFVEKVETATHEYVFADMKITGTMQPDSLTDLYLSEANQQNIAQQAKTFGAQIDDVENVVITFEANGHKWIFCPQAVRYDGRWYLQSMQGNIANLLGLSVYMGGIMPTDVFPF